MLEEILENAHETMKTRSSTLMRLYLKIINYLHANTIHSSEINRKIIF